MTDLLARLSSASEIHEVKEADVGFSIMAKPGRIDDFSLMVREALECPDPPFVVFATPIRSVHNGHYERAHVLPL
ncbi:hypothetical protein ABIC32_001396 [Brevundimonas sp. 1080]